MDSVLRNGFTYCCLLPTRSTGAAYIAFRTQAVHCIPCWTSTRAASTAYIGFRTPAVHCIPYSSSTLYSVLEQYIAFRTQAVLLVLATAIPYYSTGTVLLVRTTGSRSFDSARARRVGACMCLGRLLVRSDNPVPLCACVCCGVLGDLLGGFGGFGCRRTAEISTAQVS